MDFYFYKVFNLILQSATDFKLNVEEDHVTAFIDEIKLEAESSKTFALNLTLK